MNLSKKKLNRVIMWSYGDEGKTYLLYRGLLGLKNFTTIHTVGFNVETIDFNGVNITFYDVGGACKIKDLRSHYLPISDAVIFLIDSSVFISDTYFYENIEEFKRCLPFVENIPLLIAITKIDIRKEKTLDLINAYQLQDLYKRKAKFGIIECSSFTMEGIKEIKYWCSSICQK